MPELTLSEIPEQIAAHLPSASRLEYPTQGMTSDVAFATGRERSVVVKRCAREIYVPWLRREHTVLRSLANLDLPIPRAIAYREVPADAGPEAWLVISRLRGTLLCSAISDGGASDRIRLLAALGELLKRLHATTPPPALTHASDWIARTLAEGRANLDWCDGTRELMLELERTRPRAVRETLIHGDLALDNVLVDERGALALIDWSQGDSGDHRYDLAVALRTSPPVTLTDADLRAFHDSYGAAPLTAETRLWFERLYEFF